MTKKYKCNKCGKLKPKDEFSIDRSRSTGVKNQCKQCHNKYLTEHYRKRKKEGKR